MASTAEVPGAGGNSLSPKKETGTGPEAKEFYLLTGSRPFYAVSSKEVAEKLAELLRRDADPFDEATDPIRVVDRADLDFAQRVSSRQQIGVLEEIESVGDWDPGIWADVGLPHDQQTVRLMHLRYQARQWEPHVRDELGISPRPAVPADAGAARTQDETCRAKGTFAPWKDRIEKAIMEDIAHVANCEEKVLAAVAVKDLSGVLQAFAEDLRYWSGGVLKDVYALFMPDGELGMSLLRGTWGAGGPFWLNRPFVGAYEAREMLEWHKSLEYAETFAQRVGRLLDARAKLREFLARHPEAPEESPPGDILGHAEAMAKECRGIAFSLADHVDLLARQTAEPGGKEGRDAAMESTGATINEQFRDYDARQWKELEEAFHRGEVDPGHVNQSILYWLLGPQHYALARLQGYPSEEEIGSRFGLSLETMARAAEAHGLNSAAIAKADYVLTKYGREALKILSAAGDEMGALAPSILKAFPQGKGPNPQERAQFEKGLEVIGRLNAINGQELMAAAARDAQQAQEGSQASAESVPDASNRLRRGPNPEVSCDDKTCRYIRKHPGRSDITVDEIAGEVGYSRSMVAKTKTWKDYHKIRQQDAEQRRKALLEKQGMDDDFVGER